MGKIGAERYRKTYRSKTKSRKANTQIRCDEDNRKFTYYKYLYKSKYKSYSAQALNICGRRVYTIILVCICNSIVRANRKRELDYYYCVPLYYTSSDHTCILYHLLSNKIKNAYIFCFSHNNNNNTRMLTYHLEKRKVKKI